MNKQSIIERCERALSYVFEDKTILVRALTHSSGAETYEDSNERMEFLGDAVLGYVVCDLLYRLMPQSNEGDLTKVKSAVVSRACCRNIAQDIGLEEFIITGKGFRTSAKLPSSLLANALEAIIAAIYLDGGMKVVRRFIRRYFEPEIKKLSMDIGSENFKSVLQHLGQKEFNSLPRYVLLDEKGPDHCKCFKIEVRIGPKRYASAWGNTKKEAEQKAAENAICQIQGEEPPYYVGD